MEKLKKLFSTPERKIITVVCIVLILAIAGAGTVMAVRANAQHNAIGVESAMNFAFADAGVDPASARVEHTEFEFENGRFVYEIEFTADGAEYDYLVSAADGAIVKKEVERVRNGAAGEPVPATVTLEAAKSAALADAGLAESDVTFTKTRLDTEDGFAVYDIDFYTADSEYEYEIDALTGAVISKSKEIWGAGRPVRRADTCADGGSVRDTDSRSVRGAERRSDCGSDFRRLYRHGRREGRGARGRWAFRVGRHVHQGEVRLGRRARGV